MYIDAVLNNTDELHYKWFKCLPLANELILQGDTLDYLGIPGFRIAGGQGIIVIAICQVLLMVGPEYARYCGIEALEPLGIYLPGDINYPGGALFDPLGLSKDPVAFEELKVKEIKNGRLAMVAWIGFYAQAAVTGKGPVQNLIEHLSDPLRNNVLSPFLWGILTAYVQRLHWSVCCYKEINIVLANRLLRTHGYKIVVQLWSYGVVQQKLWVPQNYWKWDYIDQFVVTRRSEERRVGKECQP